MATGETQQPKLSVEAQLDEALRIIESVKTKVANRRAADMEVPPSWLTKLAKAQEMLDAVQGAKAAQQKALGGSFEQVRKAVKGLDQRIREIVIHNANYGGLLQVAAALAIRCGIPMTVQAASPQEKPEKNFLLLNLPSGQVSFSILSREAASMTRLSVHDAGSAWDGHDTTLKRNRILAFMDLVAESGNTLPS